MDTCNIAIENGGLEFICHDDLEALLWEGNAKVRRVSHVEWKNSENGNGWTADMSPVNGPELGPFVTRKEALNSEHEWLVENCQL